MNDDRLRRLLEEAAPPAPDGRPILAELGPSLRRARRRRRQQLVAGSGALLIAGVVGVGTLLSGGAADVETEVRDVPGEDQLEPPPVTTPMPTVPEPSAPESDRSDAESPATTPDVDQSQVSIWPVSGFRMFVSGFWGVAASSVNGNPSRLVVAGPPPAWRTPKSWSQPGVLKSSRSSPGGDK